jgi:plasmid stabilization system protein ParE
MNPRPHISRTARREYDHAIDWYEDERAGLGVEFQAAVESLLDVIAEQPDRFVVAEEDVREASLTRFPYTIYYRVRPTRIEVIAVFHQSRNPDEWRSRT